MNEYYRGHGGIGRHDGLKIRCLVIVREGSSPSVPIIDKKLILSLVSSNKILFLFGSHKSLNFILINTSSNTLYHSINIFINQYMDVSL